VAGWVRENWPALSLALLAPSIAELLSGSTKITVLFYSPLFFLIDFAGLVLLYGGGALLIREAAVRWSKGWASVLLLGAAYAIVEEGLAVHTFFQPGGDPVDALGSFGRFGGVNVLWAVGLIVYHATISISLPILLVELMYPATKGRSFLGTRALWATVAGYVGVVVLFAAAVPHFPSTVLFVLFLSIVVGLVLLARMVPRGLLRPREGPPSAPWWAFVVAGATMMTDWVICGYGGPALFHSAWIAGAVFLAVLAADLAFLLRYAGTRDARLVQFWFAAGMIGWFIVFWDVILEIGAVPGILILSVVFAVYLYWLRGRIGATDGPAPPPLSPPPLELANLGGR
jgi:hypothetical protein